MSFPLTRLRRLRRTGAMRDLVRETVLHPSQLVQPLFVDATLREPEPVPTMPGVQRHTQKSLVQEALEVEAAGVPAVILFGVPERKDAQGSRAAEEDGVVQEAVRRLKGETGLLVVTDVCLCQYTDHGHCGILHEGRVHNDATIEAYGDVAASHAAAGADVVAPSGMMDGQVAVIREMLDEVGFKETPILAYAAKYASAFYGPFRDAAQSAPGEGDRRDHQMDPGQSDEALEEVSLDLEEGADMVMVKPALPYLDVLHRVKERFRVPTFAYQVSGEYAMLRAAADEGWLDREDALLESLIAIRRAGADGILTYAAKDAARILRE